MKKLFVLFVLGFILYGCGCLAQIPPQYVYTDSNCVATLPDYSGLIIATDNCELVEVTQIPFPGVQIMVTTVIEMRAIDASGNTTSAYFNAVLLDTIPPAIQLNPAWTGYSDQEVGDMYKVFYGWVQEMGDEWNELAAGQERTWEFPDTTIHYIEDSMFIFKATIPILEYRLDEGYWEGETPNLTAMFSSTYY